MIKATHLTFLISTFVVFVISSCTKYEAGTKGDPGTPGKAGNLLTSQFSKTLDSLDWSKDQVTWVSTIFSDQITAKVISKGEVKVYLSVDSNWWALPYGKDYIFTQSSIEEGRIKLLNSHIHGGVPSRPSKTNYRVVIMTPAD